MSTIQQTKQAEQESDPILSFRCPEDLRKAVRVKAAIDDTSIQQVCIDALREYTAKAKKPAA